jgi:predicted enzyme related to lactoylglutathione lyase
MFRDCLPNLYCADLGAERAVRADDVDRATEQLRAAGVPVLREPWDSGNGQRVAYVTDPDGNRVHLYA